MAQRILVQLNCKRWKSITMTIQNHYLEVVGLRLRTENYSIFGPGLLLVLLNQLPLFAWWPYYSFVKYLNKAGTS